MEVFYVQKGPAGESLRAMRPNLWKMKPDDDAWRGPPAGRAGNRIGKAVEYSLHLKIVCHAL